jgi:hypothetical protein
MSYDIFFVRRDPGQTLGDALADVEESYEGGDPGPLTAEDLEQWDAVLPVARAILGSTAEITQDDEETRELTDPVSGIGLTLVSGEFQVHVPEHRTAGDGDAALMSTVYDLARAVEDATGLEGYDPQLEQPISDASDLSPTRRRWADEDDEPEDDAETSDAEQSELEPAGRGPRRWWEFWKP